MSTIAKDGPKTRELAGETIAKRNVFINKRLKSDVKCVILRAGKNDLTFARVSECSGFDPERAWVDITHRYGGQEWTVDYDEFSTAIFDGWTVADVYLEADHETAIVDNLMFDLDRKVNPFASQLLRTLLEDAEQRGYEKAPSCNCNCGRW